MLCFEKIADISIIEVQGSSSQVIMYNLEMHSQLIESLNCSIIRWVKGFYQPSHYSKTASPHSITCFIEHRITVQVKKYLNEEKENI